MCQQSAGSKTTDNNDSLPSASDAGYGNDSSEMTKKDQTTDTEDGSDGNVEPTVAVQ